MSASPRLAAAVRLSQRASVRRDSGGVSAGATDRQTSHTTKPRHRHGKSLAGKAHKVTAKGQLRGHSTKDFAPHLPQGRKRRSSQKDKGAISRAAASVAVAVHWDYHNLLTENLKARGFSMASLVALRCLTEGTESGLHLVKLAFFNALHDTAEAWAMRHKKVPTL